MLDLSARTKVVCHAQSAEQGTRSQLLRRDPATDFAEELDFLSVLRRWYSRLQRHIAAGLRSTPAPT